MSLGTSGAARAESTGVSPSTASLGALGAGIRAERAGDHARAVTLLVPIAGDRSLLGDYARLYLARGYIGLARDADATTPLEELLRLYPGSRLFPDAAYQLGNVRRRGGDCGQGSVLLALARDKAGSDPLGADAALDLASCLQRAGRFADARQALAQVRDTWPLERADRDARAALELLDAAHPELKPRPTVDGAIEEAKLLSREGENEKSVALLEGLARDNQGSPDVLPVDLELAAGLKRVGRLDDRERLLREVIRASPAGGAGQNAAMMLATQLWNRGRNRETVAILDDLDAHQPPASMRDEILYMRARIHEEAQSWTPAITLFQRLVREYPKSDRAADALWRWTWISYRHEPPARHLATFEQTHALARSPDVAHRIRFWQAMALDAAGQSKHAAEILEALASDDPTGYYGRLAKLGPHGERPALKPLTGTESAASRALSTTTALDALTLGPSPAKRADIAERLERARALSDALLDDLALAELDAAAASADLDDASRVWAARLYASLGSPNRALRAIQKARSGGLSSEAQLELGSIPIERFLYPLPFPYHLRRLAAGDALDPLLVASLIRNESAFDPHARSPADARGLMQIIPSTARRLAAEVPVDGFELDQLFQPRVSMTLGCHYLASLLTRYGGDLERAVAAYNAGEEAVDRWTKRDPELRGAAFAESIPYSETRAYVRNVVRDWLAYRETYLGSM